jgi:pilus assembly protein Flp/PilA
MLSKIRPYIRKETTVQRNYLRCREFALNELQQLLQRPESGQGMVEYALILVLIAIVVIVILTTVGKQVNNVFSNISHGLSN